MTEQLLYRLPWQSPAVYPGAHTGQTVGAGPLFKRHGSLLAHPDPRRIDVRASVLNPFGDYQVRLYQQQSNITVWVIADLSASMGYADKPEILRQFVQTSADSAFAYGDKFGFIGCGDHFEQRWFVAASQQHATVTGLCQQLAQHRFSGSAKHLAQAAQYLPSQRAMVFLLTDCHYPLPQLRNLLATLQGHDVIPLVLWHPDDYTRLPQWGLLALQDLESQHSRLLLMRPSLRPKLQTAYWQRHLALKNSFRAMGSEPLFMTGPYSTPTINHFLQQRAA